MMLSQTSRTVSRTTVHRAVAARRNRTPVLRVRAEAPLSPESAEPTASLVGADGSASVAVSQTQFLGSVQEAINGRSAMMGFAAAIVSEALTHHSVWSQIAGKYVNTQMVEAPLGGASYGFFAVVVLTTMASLMPKLIDDIDVDGRSFGPFTPGLENLLGRVAMMGFSGLLVVEAVKQSSLL